MDFVDGKVVEIRLKKHDIHPGKRPILYSAGDDDTSYKGNQLSRVISLSSGDGHPNRRSLADTFVKGPF